MNSDNRHHSNGPSYERIAIFIDGSNLYHSLEENCNRFDLDFAAFSFKLSRGRALFRTYYYNVLRDPERNPQAYQDQQKFLAALYSTPYLEVRLGQSKVRGDIAIEKGIDIMLATDLLRFAWDDLYDVAILVSGDGDFAYALQAVKDMGKHVEVAAFPANLSWELAHVADERDYFTPEFFADLWSRRRGPTWTPGNDYQRRGTWRTRRPYVPRPDQPDWEAPEPVAEGQPERPGDAPK
jgi:uncharacterized LabA/DUF88 family protein